MKTLESLNGMFKRTQELYVEQRNLLTEYLDKALQHAGGSIEMTGFYKDYDEATENDVEFEEQFPASIIAVDKHTNYHEILVTKLYKIGDLFYVDGYDRIDGEWTEQWFTDGSNETMDSLACFINHVLNPKEEEESPEDDTEADEEVKSFTSQVIGWQIVDDEQNYPSNFGCWDMFRTKEDAEAYIEDNLDPEEYHAVEEWSTSNVNESHYTIYEMNCRTFEKGERVWAKEGFNSRFVQICKKETVRWGDDVVKVKELNTGDEWIENWVRADNLYHIMDAKKHAESGLPLHITHIDEKNHTYYSPDGE